MHCAYCCAQVFRHDMIVLIPCPPNDSSNCKVPLVCRPFETRMHCSLMTAQHASLCGQLLTVKLLAMVQMQLHVLQAPPLLTVVNPVC